MSVAVKLLIVFCIVVTVVLFCLFVVVWCPFLFFCMFLQQRISHVQYPPDMTVCTTTFVMLVVEHWIKLK